MTLAHPFAAAALIAAAIAGLVFPTTAQPPRGATLVEQFGDWGVYTARPVGALLCFALSRPASIGRLLGLDRGEAYAFVSTRPAEGVRHEISFVVGHRLKTDGAFLIIGGQRHALYTQGDGAWIKDLEDEPEVIGAMRRAPKMVLEAQTAGHARIIDVYSLDGVAAALDRVAMECR